MMVDNKSDRWSMLGGEYFGMNFGLPGVVFAEVKAADYRILKYDIGSSISPNGTLGPSFIGKTSWGVGDNLIGIPKENPNRIYHIRWNVYPRNNMRVYEWFETTQTGNLDNETRDKTSDFGYLTGDRLDIHPEYSERLIPYMSKLQFSFYNKRVAAATPEMTFDIFEYIIRYINPDVQSALAEDLLFGNIPRKIYPMGDAVSGLPGYASASEIRQKLGVKPMMLPEYSSPGV